MTHGAGDTHHSGDLHTGTLRSAGEALTGRAITGWIHSTCQDGILRSTTAWPGISITSDTHSVAIMPDGMIHSSMIRSSIALTISMAIL